MPSAIRILFVEDDPDFRLLLRSAFQEHPDFERVGEAANKDDAILMACSLRPDIVLMDLKLSAEDLDGVQAARQIRISTDAKVVILTGLEDQETAIDVCKSSFAAGYIFKSHWQQMVPMIRQIALGTTPMEIFIQSMILSVLTEAEKMVFHAMTGAPVHLLAAEKTIANQKTSIFRKLGVKNSQELIHVFGRYPEITRS